ncbi:hypothetical protein BASA81_002725 [Batrachochytrium salamandrivorans]|nr:hypothetical protein BASA81_002725 [Batrachochytrium salamandrivorans]
MELAVVAGCGLLLPWLLTVTGGNGALAASSLSMTAGLLVTHPQARDWISASHVALTGVIVGPIGWFATLVLLSAEVNVETLWLSLLMSNLTVTGALSRNDGKIGGARGWLEQVWSRSSSVPRPVYAALLGLWLGAIPLPLDWDQAWQVYPLPSYVLATALWLLSSFLSSAPPTSKPL